MLEQLWTGNGSTTSASTDTSAPTPTTVKTLLIGDSIIEDIDQAKLDATDLLFIESGKSI